MLWKHQTNSYSYFVGLQTGNGYLAVEATAVVFRKKFLFVCFVCVCVLILFRKQVYLVVCWLVLLI